MGLFQGLLGRFEFICELEDLLSEVVDLCLELVRGNLVMSSVLLGALFIQNSIMIYRERDNFGVLAVDSINK